MQQYLDLIRAVLDAGTWRENRTGVRTISLPGASMRFDLQEGFPAVTTKKLAFKSAMGELVGFLRGTRSAEVMRAFGSKVWDANANENPEWLSNPYREGLGDLGPVYGVQWRAMPAFKHLRADTAGDRARQQDAMDHGYKRIAATEDGAAVFHKPIDQLRDCLDTIMRDPGSRRILFHAWNPAQLDEMALPPCHLLYQFLCDPERRELSMCLYMRSNDLGLGAPFNMAEGAALMHLVGRLTGYRPRWFSYFIADAHIYESHIDMVREQLRRPPLPAPRLVISDRVPDFAVSGRYEPDWLDGVAPTDFSLEGYAHHPPISAPMAV